jgi:hypothetical protein
MALARPVPARPAASARERRLRPRGRGFRIVMRLIAAALTASLLVTGWSLGHALTVPGGGTFAERVAEWARNHYLGPLVTFGEWIT